MGRTARLRLLGIAAKMNENAGPTVVTDLFTGAIALIGSRDVLANPPSVSRSSPLLLSGHLCPAAL
jgi:hypothetical protein